ncbi:DUF305 domain-containing protein [uncultured Helicobacter sp.]|uniref:DUF305 domain-containing protein n=1 Tax=uncultured Helicobacter sp. TaxID=175537 RepID=UPI001C3A1D3C|nr:DUF305 domain-containing protein [Candidatus Helicobacter avicola]
MTLLRFAFVLGFFATGWIFANAHSHEHHAHHNHGESTPSQAILDSMHAPMMAQAPCESKSPEIDYLTDMIPHHQGAVDSATLLLPHITNDELKTLAQNIIQSQTKEIAEFKALLSGGTLSNTELLASNYQEFLKANKKAMDTMMRQMNAVKPTDNIQKDFVQAMIAHHNGAIKTSKIILAYTKDPQVRKIAQGIIADQESEVKLMQKLLTKL